MRLLSAAWQDAGLVLNEEDGTDLEEWLAEYVHSQYRKGLPRARIDWQEMFPPERTKATKAAQAAKATQSTEPVTDCAQTAEATNGEGPHAPYAKAPEAIGPELISRNLPLANFEANSRALLRAISHLVLPTVH